MDILNEIEEQFKLTAEDISNIMSSFQDEMAKGLAGEKSCLKMIPSHFARPSGMEKGRYMAIDLGGTNFRILLVELKGRNNAEILGQHKYTLKEEHIMGTKDELFGFIAHSIKNFMALCGMRNSADVRIGFTFSFPVDQTGKASGRLAKWTKGFSSEGVVGEDVVMLLDDALRKAGVNNTKITALVNDTVGTLVAGSYDDPDCDMGVILGTGTNACYAEKTINIKKWKDDPYKNSEMIINIEWGNFNVLNQTVYDRELDERSDNPGDQIMEKMVSGIYLGELFRLVIIKMTEKGLLGKGFRGKLFTEPGRFRSEHMSSFESDKSDGLSLIKRFLDENNIANSTEERRIIKEASRIVSVRAGRISAALIAAVIAKMSPDLSKKHTVAVDGSVYEKHSGFPDIINKTLREIFGGKSAYIKLKLTKDGSGVGAAIMAAWGGS